MSPPQRRLFSRFLLRLGQLSRNPKETPRILPYTGLDDAADTSPQRRD